MHHVREPRKLWSVCIEIRLDVILFLTLCLALGILGGKLIEAIFVVFFDDLLVALRPLCADLVGDLPDLFFILTAFNLISALFQMCSLLFER